METAKEEGEGGKDGIGKSVGGGGGRERHHFVSRVDTGAELTQEQS